MRQGVPFSPHEGAMPLGNAKTWRTKATITHYPARLPLLAGGLHILISPRRNFPMKKTANSYYTQEFWNFQKGNAYNQAMLHSIPQPDESAAILPDETLAKFRAEQAKMNIFRNIATVMYIGSAEKRIKTLPPAGIADFVPESWAILENIASVTPFNIESYKIAKLTKMSNETLRDSGFDLEAALVTDFGRAFGLVEERGIINGTGVNQPYGLLHDTEGAEVGVTATGTLTFDHVHQLFFNLAAEYRRSACWLMSNETALFVRTLKDSTGGYIWNDFDNSIFGKPVYTSPYMPPIGAGNILILFGDFSFLWLMERAGIIIKPLIERYAVDNMVGYIATEFIDARLVEREAVKGLVIAE